MHKLSILFITDAYPRTTHPNTGVFVYNLAQEFVKLGHEVNLIAFQGVHPKGWFRKSNLYGQELANVRRFRLLTASAIRIGKFNTYSITLAQKVFWVKYASKKHFNKYDVVYCHFIESAIFASKALASVQKPMFVAVGENKNLENYFHRHKENDIYKAIERVTGFIAVSYIIKEKLNRMFGISSQKIIVEPNATMLDIYRPLDKKVMRKKYGFPLDAFIVIFVGRYIENKGPLRVLEATKSLVNTKMIFVGEGPQNPSHENIIFNEKVPRNQIPELLNCSDVFVLPTLHEGSNNAIVEAMACGLPIISSDISEVHVQCNPGFSILVDPMDVVAIKNALIKIKENPKLAAEMSSKAIEHAGNFDLSKRASRIIDFLQSSIKYEDNN